MATEITPEMVGQMVLYNGAGYHNDEIAAKVGVSESSVSKYLNLVEDEARNADQPLTVVWEHIMATQFDADFRRDIASGLAD